MLDEATRLALEAAMNNARHSLESSVDALKHDPRMSQIIDAHQTLNKIEDMIGKPKTSLAQIFGLQEEVKDDSTVIRPDEFFGYKPLDAAKLFLKKKGQACSLSSIAAGIRMGGGIVDSEEELGKALSRSTYQIAKIGDSYGLLEFYPHIQRGRGKKKRAVGIEEEDQEALSLDEIDEVERPNEEYQAQQEAQEQAALTAAEEAAG